MEYNIINTYIKFINNRLLDFFKIILKNKYQKAACELFIEKYIDVRYYDETNHSTQKDFITRLNKDLIDVYNENVNENNKQILRTIVALFGYLTYLDDLNNVKEDLEVINMLTKDTRLKIDNQEDLNKALKDWYIDFKNTKEKFYKSIQTREFNLTENKIFKNVSEVKLEHNVKVSNLYSEYAINKAYNSGTVNEDKLFITYILTTYNILNNAIALDFSKKYIVELSSSLYSKEKKIQRLLNIIDSPLAKKLISIKVSYKDYLAHKDMINKKIKEGYSFSLILDDDNVNTNELILFSYIYVFEDSEIFGIIKDDNKIGAKIIKM